MVKNPSANARDVSSIPGLAASPAGRLAEMQNLQALKTPVLLRIFIFTRGLLGCTLEFEQYRPRAQMYALVITHIGFSGCRVVKKKNNTCQCRRPDFGLWVRKIPPEEDMTAHSSIIAWRIPRTEEKAGYSPWGCRAGHP